MASKSVAGEYTSQAVFQLAESAANTLTFEKLETGLSVYDKVGWVVQRLDFMPAGLPSVMNGSGDTLTCALTMTNQLTSLSAEDPAVLAMYQESRWDFGTAASAGLVRRPFVLDFTGLSGGGLLILPNPIYLGIVGSGLSSTCTVVVRMYFKAIEMSDQDYFNLVQARQLLIST